MIKNNDIIVLTHAWLVIMEYYYLAKKMIMVN